MRSFSENNGNYDTFIYLCCLKEFNKEKGCIQYEKHNIIE